MRQKHKIVNDLLTTGESQLCGLCGRPLEVNADKHHLVPKAYKGKETVLIHKICHGKIHSVFTEKELATYYNTFDRLLENEHIQAFVKWVSKKDPDFYDTTKDQQGRKKKRR